VLVNSPKLWHQELRKPTACAWRNDGPPGGACIFLAALSGILALDPLSGAPFTTFALFDGLGRVCECGLITEGIARLPLPAASSKVEEVVEGAGESFRIPGVNGERVEALATVLGTTRELDSATDRPS